MPKLKRRGWILFVLSISQFFGLSLWFSANTVMTQLVSHWRLGTFQYDLMSVAVTTGFVIGCIASSLLNLADLVRPNRLFAFSSLAAGFSNAAFSLALDFPTALFFRMMTGVFLASVYPVGMKLVSTWFREERGFAIGVNVGAVTAGSGLPYFFSLTGIPDWRMALNVSTVLALLGGLLTWTLIEEGPFGSSRARFDIGKVKNILSNRPVVLANLGYLGHMWELYGMWTWIPLFLKESFQSAYPQQDPKFFSTAGAFLVFLSGAVSTGLGGKVADRYGRTMFNIIMLSASGTCSILIGLFFNNPYASVAIAVIWGMSIVADSPQYSSMTTELSDQQYVGTALSLQTAMGFLLTIASIRTTSFFAQIVGWQYGLLILFLGPCVGIASLLLLRREPDSLRIAGGKK